MCDHFHESTSRYDHSAKVLTLLAVVGILMLRPQGLFALKVRK